MPFIEKIDYLLNRKKVAKGEFLKAVGFNKSAYNSWKTGFTKSYMSKIDVIADYFGVSVDYLLDREKPFSPAITEEEILIETFRGCDEERQAAILRYAIDQRQLCELHSQTADKGGD